MICPICNGDVNVPNVAEYNLHEHVLGKYEVNYTSNKTHVYIGNSWDATLLLEGLIYLTDERVEKLLLLK